MDFLQDIPTDNPQFRFREYSEGLGAKILSLHHVPTVIGVFAGWGMGKTTFMRELERYFQNQDVKTLWLSAWRYNELQEVQSALIVELAARIGEETGAWEKATAVIQGLLQGGMKGILSAAASQVPFGQLILQTGSDITTNVQSVLHNPTRGAFQNSFEDTFQELVQDYINSEEKPEARLVVFLDDIDRCLPSKAINVLESLKLYLDKGPLIFIVGADRQVI